MGVEVNPNYTSGHDRQAPSAMMFGPVKATLMKASAGPVWSVPIPRFSGGAMVASTRPVWHIQPHDDPARGRSHGAWGSAASYLPATLSTASATASTSTANAGGAVARHVPHVERSDRHIVGLTHADEPGRRLVHTEPANAHRACTHKALHDCCVAIRRVDRRVAGSNRLRGVIKHEQQACCSQFRSTAAARCVAARRRARPFPGADPMLDARRSNTTPRPVGGRL